MVIFDFMGLVNFNIEFALWCPTARSYYLNTKFNYYYAVLGFVTSDADATRRPLLYALDDTLIHFFIKVQLNLDQQKQQTIRLSFSFRKVTI